VPPYLSGYTLGFNFLTNEPFFYYDEHEEVLGDGIFRGTQFGFFSSWAYYLVKASLVNGIIVFTRMNRILQ
jgi:hypothetical protein